MILRLIAALITLGLLASPAAAAPSQPVPLAWRLQQRIIQTFVEQDNWATNPDMTCTWDVDDIVNWTTNNIGQFRETDTTFPSGSTITMTECITADSDHLIGLLAIAEHGQLDFKIQFSSYVETRTFRVTDQGIDAAGHHIFKGCIRSPAYQNGPPTYQIPIPGSTGNGVPTTVTVSITNNGPTLNSNRRSYGLQGSYNVELGTAAALAARCPSGQTTQEAGLPIDHQPWFDPWYRYDGMTQL